MCGDAAWKTPIRRIGRIMAEKKSKNANTELLNSLIDEGVTYVYPGLFDHDGVWRCKKIPLDQFSEFLASGWSFIDALPWWGPNDTVRDDRAFKSEICEFDISSIRDFPFEPDSVAVVADYAGENMDRSARSVLRTQIEKAKKMGFDVLGASEFEFIVLNQSGDELNEFGYDSVTGYSPENRCWSGVLPSASADLLARYEETLSDGEIDLHHICSELGPGCLEASLPVKPLLRAADDAAFFKLFTRSFFIQESKTASFMAQLSDNFPGLGGHPIISLRDRNTGKPLLFNRSGKLSIIGKKFVAGIVRLIPELTALYASNINSYRRYAPGNWAPRTATWGYGNYTCGLRLVGEPIEQGRLEFRLPGADVNPFSAFSMMLGAGLYGIKNDWNLPPETKKVGREQVHSDIGMVPRNLLEAAVALSGSEVAPEIFGKKYIEHCVACCIHEDEHMRSHVSSYERERYLFHV